MKPYRGIVILKCNRGKKKCPEKIIDHVRADCAACKLCIFRIVDFEDKILLEKKLEKKKGSRVKKTINNQQS